MKLYRSYSLHCLQPELGEWNHIISLVTSTIMPTNIKEEGNCKMFYI